MHVHMNNMAVQLVMTATMLLASRFRNYDTIPCPGYGWHSKLGRLCLIK